jgi:hypothetical protein
VIIIDLENSMVGTHQAIRKPDFESCNSPLPPQ